MLVRELLVVVPDLAYEAMFSCTSRTLGLVLGDASVKASEERIKFRR
jgi:hypothetical protein